jgi:hypothetical protein
MLLLNERLCRDFLRATYLRDRGDGGGKVAMALGGVHMWATVTEAVVAVAATAATAAVALGVHFSKFESKSVRLAQREKNEK